MDDLLKKIALIEREWQKYMDEAASFLSKAPKGRIRCSSSHGKYKQFLITDRDDIPPDHYARSEQKELVRQLAQKEYYQRILACLDPALRKLQAFMKWYEPDIVDKIYRHLPEAKQALVEPIRPTDEEFVKEWLAALKPQDNDFPLSDKILTNKGEPVRSKSEKIIADKLYDLGIPYVYESPLILKGFGAVSPDFTVLNVRTRQTFYFEHFGLMDDPGYADKNLRKIAAYEKNGFWFGEGLLYTFETSDHSLDTGVLNQMIRRYLL